MTAVPDFPPEEPGLECEYGHVMCVCILTHLVQSAAVHVNHTHMQAQTCIQAKGLLGLFIEFQVRVEFGSSSS